MNGVNIHEGHWRNKAPMAGPPLFELSIFGMQCRA